MNRSFCHARLLWMQSLSAKPSAAACNAPLGVETRITFHERTTFDIPDNVTAFAVTATAGGGGGAAGSDTLGGGGGGAGASLTVFRHIQCQGGQRTVSISSVGPGGNGQVSSTSLPATAGTDTVVQLPSGEILALSGGQPGVAGSPGMGGSVSTLASFLVACNGLPGQPASTGGMGGTGGTSCDTLAGGGGRGGTLLSSGSSGVGGRVLLCY